MKKRRFGVRALAAAKQEIGMLGIVLVLAALVLAFSTVASEMGEGETRTFDRAVMAAIRDKGADPIGPPWLEAAMNDITSLGSTTVLSIVTFGTAGFLLLSGGRRAALLVLLSTAGGVVLIQVLKDIYGRVRPDVVPQSAYELMRSFPSGHATLAAVTYLTLGALIARVQSGRARKLYVVLFAITLTLLVGVSRVYLGRHWPTDVLAGWCLGAAWAMVCWVVELRLQRRGVVENAEDLKKAS